MMRLVKSGTRSDRQICFLMTSVGRRRSVRRLPGPRPPPRSERLTKMTALWTLLTSALRVAPISLACLLACQPPKVPPRVLHTGYPS